MLKGAELLCRRAVHATAARGASSMSRERAPPREAVGVDRGDRERRQSRRLRARRRVDDSASDRIVLLPTLCVSRLVLLRGPPRARAAEADRCLQPRASFADLGLRAANDGAGVLPITTRSLAEAHRSRKLRRRGCDAGSVPPGTGWSATLTGLRESSRTVPARAPIARPCSRRVVAGGLPGVGTPARPRAEVPLMRISALWSTWRGTARGG